MDIGSSSPQFTWRGPLFQGYNRVFERLDRGLVNQQWQLEFLESSVRVLARIKLDHHPILLDTFGFYARGRV